MRTMRRQCSSPSWRHRIVATAAFPQAINRRPARVAATVTVPDVATSSASASTCNSASNPNAAAERCQYQWSRMLVRHRWSQAPAPELAHIVCFDVGNCSSRLQIACMPVGTPCTCVVAFGSLCGLHWRPSLRAYATSFDISPAPHENQAVDGPVTAISDRPNP